MENTILSAAKFLAAGIIAHLLICHLAKPGKFMLNGLLTGLIVFLAACALQFRTGGADLLALYMLGTAWLAYLMFFINLLNSVTLKMLERLAAEPRGALSAAQFAGLFDESSGLNARLADMNRNGFMKTSGGRLLLTAKAAGLLRLVFLARKILSVDVTG